MKLAVVGLGQCGGRIADEFARTQMRARGLRGIDIIAEVVAVDTDTAGLAGIASVKPDTSHRILVGAAQSRGHGAAGSGELGAEIMRGEAVRIFEAFNRNPKSSEADAMVVVAATAGGTGSGGAPILIRALKERISDKPVYALLVLPFDHEESEPNTVLNTAACLEDASAVADAVLLFDNQRHVSKENSVKTNMQKSNQAVVEPFFNLLCSGEDRKAKTAGKPLETADIIATLDGWTAIGYGKAGLTPISLHRDELLRRDVRSEQGVRAMNEALAELSFACKPAEAYKALYLVSGHARELSLDMTETLGAYMRKTAPHAQLRGSQYPHDKRLDVTVVLSNFGESDRLKRYREKARGLANDRQLREQSKADRVMLMEEAGKDIPSLL